MAATTLTSMPCQGAARPARSTTSIKARTNGRHSVRQVVVRAAKDASNPSASDLEGMAKDLLAKDPDMAKQMAKLKESSAKVEELMKMKAEIDAQYEQAMADTANIERLQEQEAAEARATAEVSAALTAVQEAELELANAEFARAKWSVRAEEEADRLESGKAAAIAAAGGLLAALPVTLSAGEAPLLLVADLGSQLLSAALCGLVYRYAVREDSGDVQLRGGVVAGFGIVRGLGLAVSSLQSADTIGLDTVAGAALLAGESMLLMGFAAIAVEAALSKGFIAPVRRD